MLNSSFRLFLAAVLSGLAAGTLSPPTHGQMADLVPEARKLIDAKRADAAFNLLAPLESRRAGELEFDYWLGVAAFESNRLERAALAFERVLVRNPDFDSARMELGRVYLSMGSLDLAAQEFSRLLARAPNDTGRSVLQEYLARISAMKRRQRHNLSAYLELGGGRDNNLSSSTRDFSGAVLSSFGLPGIEPTGNSIRRSDSFRLAQGGVEGGYRLREDRTLLASADLRWRGYGSFRDFDYLLADLMAGYQDRSGEVTWTALAFAQYFRQDGAFVDTIGASRITNSRDSHGMSLELRRPIGGRSQLIVGAQYTAFRYQTNPGQDSNQVQMSLSLQHEPAWWQGGTMQASIYHAHDDARRSLNAFTATTASRQTRGVRLAAQSDVRATLGWLVSMGWSRRTDDDAFARATMVQTGRDELLELYARGTWRVNADWALQPYMVRVRNKSNIALYTFGKSDVGVLLRRDFR